jgi:hypothetical protein
MAYNPSNPNGQTTSANSAPVVISSDQTSNTGTTLNTGLQEIATGGASTFHLVTAGSTGNATPIKSGVSKITGWYIYNSNGSARKVNFYDTAGTPTVGSATNFKFSLVIPPLSAANAPYPAGIAFTSGIGITTTTGLTDTDSGLVAANDLIINIFYK